MRTLGGLLFLVAFLALAITWGWASAYAAGGDCNLVNDHDTRAECYAWRERSSSDCGLIYDNDERRYCRAQSGDRR